MIVVVAFYFRSESSDDEELQHALKLSLELSNRSGRR